MLSTLKPKIFRWHIPFDESMIPDQWRQLLAAYFNSYDMVIVELEQIPGFAQVIWLCWQGQESLSLR